MKKFSVFSKLFVAFILVMFAVSAVFAARYEDLNVTKLSIGGKQVTATPDQILDTTNTKTVSGKTISGLTVTISAANGFASVQDWVLSAVEMLKTLLIAESGSSGSSLNIISVGGTAGRVHIVRNATTNSTVTIKESGKTGVSIAVGTTAVVMHNGTDYIRITADATH
jgi:hypothetical protein